MIRANRFRVLNTSFVFLFHFVTFLLSSQAVDGNKLKVVFKDLNVF